MHADGSGVLKVPDCENGCAYCENAGCRGVADGQVVVGGMNG